MAYSTITKPGLHFNTVLYTGNGSTPRTVSGVGFQPDFTWIKNRSIASKSHVLVNAIQGYGTSGTTLKSNSADAEANTSTTGRVADPGATTDGFTAGDSSFTNDNSQNIVAWNWKAGGGAGSSNTDGSINTTSTSVNTTAGFSISKYTGTGSNATIGHGLGAVPEFMMVKNLSNGSRSWAVYSKYGTGANKYVKLDSNGAEDTDTATWQNTVPTNQVWSVGGSGETNGNGENFICYAFTPIKGYSNFGRIQGTGNADGPFVYTGFRPAFVLVKAYDTSSRNWCIMDDKRGYNPDIQQLHPNTDGVETLGSGDTIDIYSNGFKARTTDNDKNQNGVGYYYAAFASEPLVSNVGVGGIPATAI